VDQTDIAHAQIFGSSLLEIPLELLEVANTVRAECGTLPERLIQRRIRDTMDIMRSQAGPVQIAGLDDATKAIGDLF
jgi:hypothetical protein